MRVGMLPQKAAPFLDLNDIVGTGAGLVACFAVAVAALDVATVAMRPPTAFDGTGACRVASVLRDTAAAARAPCVTRVCVWLRLWCCSSAVLIARAVRRGIVRAVVFKNERGWCIWWC